MSIDAYVAKSLLSSDLQLLKCGPDVAGDDELGEVYRSSHPHLQTSEWERLRNFYKADSERLAGIIGEDWPRQWAQNAPVVGPIEQERQLLQRACEVRTK
eukprot:scaffold167272_cov49-Prasinocladus_malaysianus.AAC.2